MKYFIVFCLMLISCSDKIETQKDNAENFGKPGYKETGNQDSVGLQEIPYHTRYNYNDSLPKKIIPKEKYDYWAYIGVDRKSTSEGITYEHRTIYQNGDTLSKDHTIRLKNHDIGFFPGCHPQWCVKYIVAIKNHKPIFITTEEDLADFIGSIDTLEEAMIIARIKGYKIDHDIRGRTYKISNKGFEMNLVQYTEIPLKKEFFRVTVNRNGNMDIKSNGIVIQGWDALK